MPEGGARLVRAPQGGWGTAASAAVAVALAAGAAGWAASGNLVDAVAPALAAAGAVVATAAPRLIRMAASLRDARPPSPVDRLWPALSNEARAALHAIQGFTDAVLQGLDGPVNEEQRTDLEIVRRNARHLLRLAGGVQDVADLHAGRLRLRLEPVDLAGLVRDIAAELLPVAARRGLRLQCALPDAAVLRGDRLRLRQAIVQLIYHAVRASPRGLVLVELREGADRVELLVHDRGEALTPDAPRGQADGVPTLGLTLAEQLVHLHGGQVRVRPREHGGNTFACLLPRRLEPHAVPAATRAAPQSGWMPQRGEGV